MQHLRANVGSFATILTNVKSDVMPQSLLEQTILTEKKSKTQTHITLLITNYLYSTRKNGNVHILQYKIGSSVPRLQFVQTVAIN